MAGYLSLFAAAALAATLFPAQSEALLVALLMSETYSIMALIGVASAGNTLGSVINWFLGRGLEQFKDRCWFPIREDKLSRAQEWYHCYGRWSLLASWLPIIGDPITLVAGVMKEPLPVFILLVGIAKTGRYAVLAAVTLGLI
ncbi:YqaA family protein [Pseudorhizobium flavum]|uniref:Membrane protein YqaA with SNARE-associated domain n=1 Tax=Pseudorhizobium flavum TaxID=1335061 RepID=A0A7W9YW91_9HYPH|nr:YqaA family protein [Pseudorhizobium flavum]MBB6178316.1 membrane protein YqaA with SNARE-associated domain [Pseudorhizobium flavum]CAD6612998.1 DedA family protein [Pseudorhizobium flavum]